MRPRDLVLIGCGGFARETAAAVRALNAVTETWRVLGYLDDDPARHGRTVSGLPVLGPVDRIAEFASAAVLLCTGRPGDYSSRLRLATRLGLPADRYATLVHPTADVGFGCVLGEGTVLLAGAALTADVRVGSHVAVMPQVALTHDDEVDDWATIASGVRLGGGVRVGAGAYLGSGALVREGLRIGGWSMLGMGSVVTRDVPPGRLWTGCPARDVRAAPIDPQAPQLGPRPLAATGGAP